MKKVLAVMLVLVMVFALTACDNNSIVGKWEWKLKITGEMMQMEDFDGSLDVVMIFEFDKDGGYEIYVDEDALEDAFEDLKDDLVDYVVAQNGEYYRDIAEEQVANIDFKDLLGDTALSVEGKYEIDEDTLTLTPDDDDKDEEEYEFELDGDKLTLEGDSEQFEKLLEMMGKKKITLKRVK